ncbi:hypothetical protein HPB52_019793 [Rhipicephalus sanguineus]|uniref:Ig-like domain-containing protein n=1 Tax=Rhipicephalus sanguineus TaxID=34632 RepID=A0A9D4SP05_RHISA|nr:hypothetical protein HPB52_019793 [Rhipicephalus sanguineus]
MSGIVRARFGEGGEPVIVEGPRNRTVVLGSSVMLPCLVEPPPSSSGGTAGATSVLWLQDGRSLASQGSSPWRQLDTGALLLHRVDVADAGAYRCNARNAHGVAYSETAQLVVHGELLVPISYAAFLRCLWRSREQER